MSIYADSSFFVSRYVTDIHSTRVDQVLAQKPSVWLTPFNRAELSNAIHRQVFQKRLTLSQAKLAWNDFEQDCSFGIWIQVSFPNQAWETSISLPQRHGSTLGIRTLDSLHVACALELNAHRFWTFDQRQARLAEAVGLDITF